MSYPKGAQRRRILGGHKAHRPIWEEPRRKRGGPHSPAKYFTSLTTQACYTGHMPNITLNRFSKKSLIITVVALVVIVGGVVAALGLMGNKTPGSSLTPKTTLTVADNRLVNACQVLPEADVTTAFGKEGNKSYIRETYLQSSVSADNLEKASFGSIDTQCHYYFEDNDNKAVTLTVDQYKDAKSAEDDWQTAVNLGDGTYDRLLAHFEQTLATDPSANTQASRDLVAFMKASLPKAKREAGTTVAGLDKSIIFNQNRSEFLAVYKNTVLTLKYEFGSADPFDSSRAINASELSQALGPVQKAFDAAFKNLDNKNLSQAPGPTLRNNVKTVGSTKILEPCEVMNDQTFATIFGKPNNDPVVERETVTLTANVKRTHADGYPLLDGNSCLRRFSANISDAGGSVKNGYVSLELRYASDSDRAAQNLNGVVKSLSDNFTSPDFKKLSGTKADLAYARSTKTGTLLTQSVRFQKGSYVGVITISKDNDMGESVNVPEADFAKAVDTVVKRLP